MRSYLAASPSQLKAALDLYSDTSTSNANIIPVPVYPSKPFQPRDSAPALPAPSQSHGSRSAPHSAPTTRAAAMHAAEPSYGSGSAALDRPTPAAYPVDSQFHGDAAGSWNRAAPAAYPANPSNLPVDAPTRHSAAPAAYPIQHGDICPGHAHSSWQQTSARAPEHAAPPAIATLTRIPTASFRAPSLPHLPPMPCVSAHAPAHSTALPNSGQQLSLSHAPDTVPAYTIPEGPQYLLQAHLPADARASGLHGQSATASNAHRDASVCGGVYGSDHLGVWGHAYEAHGGTGDVGPGCTVSGQSLNAHSTASGAALHAGVAREPDAWRQQQPEGAAGASAQSLGAFSAVPSVPLHAPSAHSQETGMQQRPSGFEGMETLPAWDAPNSAPGAEGAREGPSSTLAQWDAALAQLLNSESDLQLGDEASEVSALLDEHQIVHKLHRPVHTSRRTQQQQPALMHRHTHTHYHSPSRSPRRGAIKAHLTSGVESRVNSRVNSGVRRSAPYPLTESRQAAPHRGGGVVGVTRTGGRRPSTGTPRKAAQLLARAASSSGAVSNRNTKVRLNQPLTIFDGCATLRSVCVSRLQLVLLVRISRDT